MSDVKATKVRRRRKVLHVRKKVFGTPVKPRLAVFRSRKNFYAQIINDMEGKTLCCVSSLSAQESGWKNNVASIQKLGTQLAEVAKTKGIERVVFDRRFYKFHGKVKAFAEAARKGGLKF